MNEWLLLNFERYILLGIPETTNLDETYRPIRGLYPSSEIKPVVPGW
ncbi:unnamed protein product [Wuchereria bancrofti]|uniref:Uncharacterized protein n=1 Tax=Wuchereria bancrofti TaxID=6293 RepID=A0A3P7EXT1_WUCBA|nr:unnamed protein product [Wuchereria bancrofti]